jgi:small conductance mechanosensitive channel
MSSIEHVFDRFLELNQARLDVLVGYLPRLMLAAAVLLVFGLIAIRVGRLVASLFRSDRSTRIIRSFTRRATALVIFLIGVFVVLPLLGLGNLATALLAGGGIGAIVLGFAFRDIGENMIAGVMLAISRPFDINDLIGSGEFEGTVESLELRHTHIRTVDGRDIYLSNSDIIKQPLVNYTRDGYRRFSFKVGVDYGDNAMDARESVESALRSVDDILEEPSPDVIVDELGTDSVTLLCHYWVDAFEETLDLANVRSEAIHQTKSRLLEEGFTLPGRIVELREFQSSRPIDVNLDHSDDPD